MFYFSIRFDGRSLAMGSQALTPCLEMAGVDGDAAEKPGAESEETKTLLTKVLNLTLACIQRCKPKKKLIRPFDAQVITSR